MQTAESDDGEGWGEGGGWDDGEGPLVIIGEGGNPPRPGEQMQLLRYHDVLSSCIIMMHYHDALSCCIIYDALS